MELSRVDLPTRCAELAKQHGSLNMAARALEIDKGYMSRIANGIKTDPSPAVLKKLGLRKIVTYVRRK